MILRAILCLTAIQLLVSCAAPKVVVNLSSTPNPTETLYYADPIVVTTRSESDLNSIYYAQNLVKEMLGAKFTDVTYVKSLEEMPEETKIVIFIEPSTNSSTYTYNQPEFGVVNDGTTTTECGYTYYGTVACNEKQGKKLAVTGYHQATGYLFAKSISIQAYNIASKIPIYQSWATTYDTKCTDNWYFHFLTKQLLERMFTKSPVKYEYAKEYRYGWLCEEY